MIKEKKSLELYVSYNSFFLSTQLQEILFDLERIYNILYASITHTDMRDIDFNNRMRIKSINTGNSIELELIEGVKTLLQSGSPMIQVSSAIGVLAISSKIIISAAKGIAEVRKIWREGTKIKYENEKIKRLYKMKDREKEKLIIIPDEAKRIVSDSAFHLINNLDYSPNVDLVRVNGSIIINKKERDNS